MRATLSFGITLLAGASFFAPRALADMDIPVTQTVTAYSGHCRYDSLGGGTTTSDGTKFAGHTVEDPGTDKPARMAKLPETDAKGNQYPRDSKFAVAAVPQKRGNMAGIFGCFFKDDKNFNGTLFKAADHYGTGSNGMSKYDAGHTCMPGINKMSKPTTSITVLGDCGGVRGGAGDEVARPHKPAVKKRRPAHRA